MIKKWWLISLYYYIFRDNRAQFGFVWLQRYWVLQWDLFHCNMIRSYLSHQNDVKTLGYEICHSPQAWGNNVKLTVSINNFSEIWRLLKSNFLFIKIGYAIITRKTWSTFFFNKYCKKYVISASNAERAKFYNF